MTCILEAQQQWIGLMDSHPFIHTTWAHSSCLISCPSSQPRSAWRRMHVCRFLLIFRMYVWWKHSCGLIQTITSHSAITTAFPAVRWSVRNMSSFCDFVVACVRRHLSLAWRECGGRGDGKKLVASFPAAIIVNFFMNVPAIHDLPERLSCCQFHFVTCCVDVWYCFLWPGVLLSESTHTFLLWRLLLRWRFCTNCFQLHKFRFR